MLTKIQGQVFEVSEPYAEGHTCNVNEATVLNRTRAENIGNNLRKRVNEVLDGEETLSDEEHAEMQAEVAAYDEVYDFSMTRVQGSSDPVGAQAKSIARGLIAKQLKSKGKTLAEYKAELGGYDHTDENPEEDLLKAGREAYNTKVLEVSERPKIQAAAKRAVEEANSADEEVDL